MLATRRIALVDVREELIFSRRHLLLARSVPLSRFELKFRRSGAAPGDPYRALRRRGRLASARRHPGAKRYTNCRPRRRRRRLAAAGFELFSGVNVPSKAFANSSSMRNGTPNIAAAELERLIRDRADIVCRQAGRS